MIRAVMILDATIPHDTTAAVLIAQHTVATIADSFLGHAITGTIVAIAVDTPPDDAA